MIFNKTKEINQFVIARDGVKNSKLTSLQDLDVK